MGGTAAFIDAEHALDPAYAAKLGVNLDELLVSQPDSGEEALTICEMLVRSNALDVVVIDSVAALVPKSELEGEMGMATMGMQARLMSQALRKLTAILNKSKTLCIFTNQIREKLGHVRKPGNDTRRQGAQFYASVRLDIRRRDIIKDRPEECWATGPKSKWLKQGGASFCRGGVRYPLQSRYQSGGQYLGCGSSGWRRDQRGAWLQFEGTCWGRAAMPVSKRFRQMRN